MVGNRLNTYAREKWGTKMTDRLSDKYDNITVSTSLSALLELQLALRSYRESLVLVGGWAPYFLLNEYGKGEFHHLMFCDLMRKFSFVIL